MIQSCNPAIYEMVIILWPSTQLNFYYQTSVKKLRSDSSFYNNNSSVRCQSILTSWQSMFINIPKVAAVKKGNESN